MALRFFPRTSCPSSSIVIGPPVHGQSSSPAQSPPAARRDTTLTHIRGAPASSAWRSSVALLGPINRARMLLSAWRRPAGLSGRPTAGHGRLAAGQVRECRHGGAVGGVALQDGNLAGHGLMGGFDHGATLQRWRLPARQGACGGDLPLFRLQFRQVPRSPLCSHQARHRQQSVEARQAVGQLIETGGQ